MDSIIDGFLVDGQDARVAVVLLLLVLLVLRLDLGHALLVLIVGGGHVSLLVFRPTSALSIEVEVSEYI